MKNGPLTPCVGMERPLSALADGRLGRLMTWFTLFHTRRCPKCRATYRAMLAVRDGLKKVGRADLASNMLSDERWKAIEDACEP